MPSNDQFTDIIHEFLCVCVCMCVAMYCTVEAALQFPGILSPNILKLTTSIGGGKKTRICEKCGTSIV